MIERRVPPSERGAFLTALSARRDAAQSYRAHFWVFEHAEDAGRFVEFTEAADEASVTAAHVGDLSASLWREVQSD